MIMEFWRKYRHIGASYPSVPDTWRPIVEKCLIQIERAMWPRWLPMFVKRRIHYWATGNSVVRIRSYFWNRVRKYLTKDQIVMDVKDKYCTLRIYGFFGNEINYIIEKAEKECARTCERCGHQGDDVKVSDQGWLYNLCEKCFLEYN